MRSVNRVVKIIQAEDVFALLDLELRWRKLPKRLMAKILLPIKYDSFLGQSRSPTKGSPTTKPYIGSSKKLANSDETQKQLRWDWVGHLYL